MTKHKGKGYQEIGAIDQAFKYENTRGTSNVVVSKKYEKQYVRLQL